LIAASGIAALSGAALGYFIRFDMPDIRALEDFRPPEMSRVEAGDGSLLDTFAEQRRILIDLADIPGVFRDALVAGEDSSFYRHTGIDFKGIARAVVHDVRTFRLAQGASTLTQQLARNLFLHPDKTFRRKVLEMLLAMEIERHYTKEEILRFYCNQVYMGHGRYGLEAASRHYFDVPARDLSLGQAATLVGLLQRPEALTPLRHPERALARRNYVLERMVEVGYLDAELAAKTIAMPLELPERRQREQPAPYFVEDVRRWLQQRFGSTSLYSEGLTVTTTLDPRLQQIANEAVDAGLRELDKRQGWRGASGRIPDGEDPESWKGDDWPDSIAPGKVYPALVAAIDAGIAIVRLGDDRGRLAAADTEWTGEKKLERLLAVGDLIQVRAREREVDGLWQVDLEQEPTVEGALVVLEPATGAVLALVGGFDFERSEFNRAIQATRQTGSAFKPLVYAAALDAGWTLADVLQDEPTVFLDPRNPQPYQPENYSYKYYGIITLRDAMERSANISTVRLLDKIGYDAVIDTAQRLGLSSEFQPFPSLGLGAFESRLLELTAAYGAFANQGVWVEPHLVQQVYDQDGGMVERIEPRVRDAVSPEIAFLMNRMLSGVITDGTGRSAASLNLNLAGKTGTTDDNTDAWFIGYSPSVAVGAWVGFDNPAPIGKRETGARAALPIWRHFMERAYASGDAGQFETPPGISMVKIDRRTGLRVNPRAYCSSQITEAYIAGTEPTRMCSVGEHQRIRLPYSFQRFALDEDDRLLIPRSRITSLLSSEPQARLLQSGRRLEVRREEEIVSISVKLIDEQHTGEDQRLRAFETATWVGRDGRPAEVVWMNGRPGVRPGS